MRIRPLNLTNALRLASLLSPYIDVKKLNPDQDALEFVDDIVQKISAQDFLLCVKMMTNKKEEDLSKMDGFKILALFNSGLKENRIVNLLSFYKSIGL